MLFVVRETVILNSRVEALAEEPVLNRVKEGWKNLCKQNIPLKRKIGILIYKDSSSFKFSSLKSSITLLRMTGCEGGASKH